MLTPFISPYCKKYISLRKYTSNWLFLLTNWLVWISRVTTAAQHEAARTDRDAGKEVSRPAAWNTKTPLSSVDNEPLQHPLPSHDRHLPGTGPPQKQFSLHTQTSQDLSRTVNKPQKYLCSHRGSVCLWLVGCGWHHSIQARRITEEEPLRHTCMHLWHFWPKL